MSQAFEQPGAAWRARAYAYGPVCLAAACLVVIPFGRLVEIPTALMAMLAPALAIRRGPRLFTDPGIARFAVAFGLIWLAALVSWPDAVNPGRTGAVVAGHLRFALAGLFMVALLRARADHHLLFAVAAWAIVIWSADVLLQAAIGRDLFGYPEIKGRLDGMFGLGAPKFGFVAVLLLPLAIAHMRRAWPPAAMLAALLVVVAAVLLGGRRAVWLQLGVLAGLYALLMFRAQGRRALVPLLWTAVAGALLVGAVYLASDRVQGRVDSALRWLRPGAQHSDSVGHRVWIWRAARNMIADNPINGVGARGFRYVFLDYAEPNDPYAHDTKPELAVHAHQLLLDVTAETGAVGLVLFLGFAGVLVATVLARDGPTRADPALVTPWALCLAASLFPFNTHLSFFSSFWAQLMWWLVAGLIAASMTGQRASDR